MKEKIKEITLHSNILLELPLFSANIQLKMFSKLLTAVRKDQEAIYYSFPIKDILNEFNFTEKNYFFLRKECEKMFKPVDFSDRNSTGFRLKTLFMDIDTETNKSLISFKLNPDLKPLIIDLSLGYTSYYIENILRLETVYSTRFYQLLKQYEKIGCRKISIDDLKYYLSIHKDKYSLYGHLKNKVIIPSQKEVKEKTDIYFTFEEIKKGRKITDVNFLIFPNKKAKTIESKKIDLDDNKLKLCYKIIDFGVTTPQALKLCKIHSLERLQNNIRYVESELKKGRKKDNLSGFVIEAIKGDYYNQTDLFKKDQEEEKINEKRKQEIIRTKSKDKEAKRTLLIKEFATKERKQFLDSLSDNDKADLLGQIKEKYKNSDVILRSIKGLDSPIISSEINLLITDFEEKKNKYLEENL